jgi:hypothetical protein
VPGVDANAFVTPSTSQLHHEYLIELLNTVNTKDNPKRKFALTLAK